MPNSKTSPTRAKHAKTGDAPTASAPAPSDIGENSASTLIEVPLRPGDGKLEHHDFADGGGSGGAEAFRRQPGK
ncbi:hypothetical protein [Polaromonas sp.]|uniref:hypothetical protein n=1 Tax=Polaromonas sp. TaxID=1869339 RepID=UPI00326523B1